MFCENPKTIVKKPKEIRDKFFFQFDEIYYEFKQLLIPNNPNVVKIPCGQCLLCRMEQRRNWALRCWLEAQEYDSNLFITLTYDDKNLPNSGVDKYDLERFMHTLREFFRRENKHSGIRFFACGEYGSKDLRAHYHILLFNCPPFADAKFYKKNKQGQSLYKSKTLERLWHKGSCVIGAVTRQSCDYVAKFRLKNFDMKLPPNLNGQFQSMSTKCGIGLNYLLRNLNEIIAEDRIYVTGNKGKIVERLPSYYDKKIAEIIGAERFEEEILKPRREKAKAFISNEMALTGLTKDEVYHHLLAKAKEKAQNEIKKISEKGE